MNAPAGPGALAGHPVIPVIVIDEAARAVDLAHALAAGGIRCAEVTLRTPAALDSLAAMGDVDDFTAGAGTVRSVAEFAAAADHGARFVVSPGFDPEVVATATERGIAALPGIATATELQHALGAGVRTVKFFPADRLGGLAGIAALAAPFPEMGFVPSGGVTAASAAEYLAHPAVPAVSGSWMAPRELIAAGDFAEIERRARATMTSLGSP
jgi:2-dehydro-3-deoxyphosphogluconate aldolase/(4S)-4-hydroxy-2-oxoglutarate aldolase